MAEKRPDYYKEEDEGVNFVHTLLSGDSAISGTTTFSSLYTTFPFKQREDVVK